eukprot:Hpha_TRINITY_DN8476_c0_g1::TRINITY_DN8476_c0_g1_i1::g.34522::m.34522/K15027/EIF2D; translation initiation factor 2D
MFSKVEVQTKGENVLRSKDAKQLRSSFASQFGLEGDEEVCKVLGPPKGNLSLRKLAQGVLPGFNRAQLLAAEGSVVALDQEGMQKRLIPVLEAVWRLPSMLPTLLVPPPVSGFLWRGADLFLPGVCGVQGHAGVLRKGTITAVRVLGNPLPIAVGEMSVSIDPEAVRRGGLGEGTALQVFNAYGDRLWFYCGRKKPNAGFAEGKVGPLPGWKEPALTEEVPEAAPAAHVDPAAGGSPGKQPEGEDAEEGEVRAARMDDGSESEEEGGEATETEGPAGMDELMLQCFAQVARTRLKKDRDLPVTVGDLYTKHLRPCRPAGTSVDVKSSSFRKAGNFAAELAKRNLLTVVTKGGGEPKITKINWGHPTIQDHEVWEHTAEQEQQQQQQAESGVASVQVTIVYRSTPATRFCLGEWRDVDLSWDQCNGALTEWLAANKVLEEGGKKAANRPVRMTPQLAELFPKDQRPAASAPFKAVVLAFQAKLQRWWVISGGRLLKPKRFQGGPPQVQLRCEMRRGHNATVVSGLEAYGLSAEELVADLKHLLACTVTVEDVMSPKGELIRRELVVQGHRNDSIAHRLVETWGVPPEACGKVGGKMKERRKDVVKK